MGRAREIFGEPRNKAERGGLRIQGLRNMVFLRVSILLSPNGDDDGFFRDMSHNSCCAAHATISTNGKYLASLVNASERNSIERQ
jgi:hypothetical protein